MKKIVMPSLVLASTLCALLAACEESSSSPAASFDASADGFAPAPGQDARPPEDADTRDVVASDVVDAAVVSADLALDFSSTANPNGAWTFGYTSASPEGDAGALVPFTTEKASADLHLWFDPNHVNLDAPSVFKNDSTATANGVAPGEAALHPGSVQEYAVARWTAPVAGTYAVVVQFKAGDTGDTNGLLLHNGVVLVNEASTSTDAVHELDVNLAAGDTLDVAVGNKGDFLYDSTPVKFSIRTKP